MLAERVQQPERLATLGSKQQAPKRVHATTIRTINGGFARVVDGMPVLRSRPPASTAQRGLPARTRLNTPVKRPCENSCGGRTAPDRAVGGARRLSAQYGVRRQGTDPSWSYHGSDRPIGSGGGRAGRAAGTLVGRPILVVDQIDLVGPNPSGPNTAGDFPKWRANRETCST